MPFYQWNDFIKDQLDEHYLVSYKRIDPKLLPIEYDLVKDIKRIHMNTSDL